MGWLKPNQPSCGSTACIDKLSFSKHRDPHLLYLSEKHRVFHFFVYKFHHRGLAAGAGRVGNVPSLSLLCLEA